MIKARVLFTFIDKTTNEQRLEGSVVELEESRAAELKALGAVDFAERPKTEAESSDVKEEPKKRTTRKKVQK